jgi:hypothetical protein
MALSALATGILIASVPALVAVKQPLYDLILNGLQIFI